MSDASRTVLDGLRAKLAGPRRASAFVADLEERIRQLLGNMVDGRVIPKPEAEALRASILDLVRSEALPKLGAERAHDALAVLDKLKAYGWNELEAERPRLEQQRAAKSPPPVAAIWPELQELRAVAERHLEPDAMKPPVEHADFADRLREEGRPIPEELVALYAAHDGFDLWCIADRRMPVFCLLPSASIDEGEAQDDYPVRSTCFEGGDSVHLSVYCDDDDAWWLVYEQEYEPVAKKPFDLPALLAFAVRRMRAPSVEALSEGELSWESFFETNSA